VSLDVSLETICLLHSAKTWRRSNTTGNCYCSDWIYLHNGTGWWRKRLQLRSVKWGHYESLFTTSVADHRFRLKLEFKVHSVSLSTLKNYFTKWIAFFTNYAKWCTHEVIAPSYHGMGCDFSGSLSRCAKLPTRTFSYNSLQFPVEISPRDNKMATTHIPLYTNYDYGQGQIID